MKFLWTSKGSNIRKRPQNNIRTKCSNRQQLQGCNSNTKQQSMTRTKPRGSKKGDFQGYNQNIEP